MLTNRNFLCHVCFLYLVSQCLIQSTEAVNKPKKVPTVIKKIVNNSANLTDNTHELLEKFVEEKRTFVDLSDKFRKPCQIIQSRGYICESKFIPEISFNLLPVRPSNH